MAKGKQSKSTTKRSSMQDSQWNGRKTLYTLKNKEGQIVELNPGNLGIKVADDPTIFLPVNLSTEFRHAGMKIKFSGEVKEIDPTELWAGQPVFLTESEKLN